MHPHAVSHPVRDAPSIFVLVALVAFNSLRRKGQCTKKSIPCGNNYYKALHLGRIPNGMRGLGEVRFLPSVASLTGCVYSSIANEMLTRHSQLYIWTKILLRLYAIWTKIFIRFIRLTRLLTYNLGNLENLNKIKVQISMANGHFGIINLLDR